MRLLLSGLIVTVGFTSGVSHAAVIYSEDPDGDLPVFPVKDVGPLSVGTSTVLGWGFLGPGQDDVDVIKFTILPGTVLDHVTVTINSVDLDPAPGNNLYRQFALSNETGFLKISATNQFTAAGPQTPIAYNFFDSILPLGAGLYYMQAGGGGYVNGGRIDYTWDLHVTTVPLPAAAWLLMSGAGLLAGFVRRRSTATLANT